MNPRIEGPGRYRFGKNLYLLVAASGAGSWIFRYQIDGRRRDMGLGPWPELPVKEAREKSLIYRRMVKIDGLDPLEQAES